MSDIEIKNNCECPLEIKEIAISSEKKGEVLTPLKGSVIHTTERWYRTFEVKDNDLIILKIRRLKKNDK